MSLLDYIMLADAEGNDVELQLDKYRHIEALDGLQGFTARTSVRTRPSQHGSVAQTRFRGDRVITASGRFFGDTIDEAWSHYHVVSRVLAAAVDTDRLLRFSIGGIELKMNVRCEEIQAPIRVSEWSVVTQYVLRASDPRAYSRYATDVTADASSAGGGGLTFPMTFPIVFDPVSGSTVGVTNNGTVDTPATIVLDGYLLDPVVRLGDRQIVFVGEVAAGDQLIINLADRDVQLNGSPGLSLLDFSQTTWFEVPPGSSTIELFAALSDASSAITVSMYDAYQ